MRWLLLCFLPLSGCGCVSFIGDGCDAAVPCGAGTGNTTYTCDSSLPGGYCSLMCKIEGDLDSCAGAVEWPRDGICMRFDDTRGVQCALRCTSDAGCRPGYRCATVNDAGPGCVL